MSKGIVYCNDTEDLDDTVRLMEQKKIRRLPVINEKKRMVGMLSLGDVSHAASREMSARSSPRSQRIIHDNVP
jgi:predicted transcriptional regulator